MRKLYVAIEDQPRCRCELVELASFNHESGLSSPISGSVDVAGSRVHVELPLV
jgi:hypothetical protein